MLVYDRDNTYETERQMSVKEMIALVGKTGTYTFDGMHVEVTIEDAKESWGRLLVQIVPVSGAGSKWTPVENVLGLGA